NQSTHGLRCRSLSHRLGTAAGNVDGRGTRVVVGRRPLTTGPTRSSRSAFSTTDCQACPSRSLCTQSSRHTRRTVTIRPQEQYVALMQRRKQEQTKEFAQVYARRAGVEGTISQGVRMMGLRRSRYIGEEKTHLQHVAQLLPSISCAVWHGSMA